MAEPHFLEKRQRGAARLLIVALVSLAAVAAALVSQYAFDMQPCPWCVLQRLIFVALAIAALLGVVWRSRTGLRISTGAVLLLAMSGAGAALWQHFVAAASASCKLTMADRLMGFTGLDRLLPQVFAAYASCADAKVNLLGVPYEYWSLALFAALAVAVARPYRSRR